MSRRRSRFKPSVNLLGVNQPEPSEDAFAGGGQHTQDAQGYCLFQAVGSSASSASVVAAFPTAAITVSTTWSGLLLIKLSASATMASSTAGSSPHLSLSWNLAH